MKRMIFYITLSILPYFVLDAHSIWLSVDPLADKYPNISPYAYCNWNLVKYVDPDGKIIKFARGTTTAQREQFWQAVRYLDQHDCGGRYGQLKNSPETYIIDMSSEVSKFVGKDRNNPRIYWDPTMGIETENGTILSPATVLNHEMTHATHYDNAIRKFRKKWRRRRME